MRDLAQLPPEEVPNQLQWDVFISYASEDRDEVARPLANLLDQMGHRVWFDQSVLTVGDSIAGSLSKGLLGSRFGVVILSPHFIKKKWTQNELSALLALESPRSKRILPVWHNVSDHDAISFNAFLGGKLAVKTDQGLEAVAHELSRVLVPWRLASSEGPIDGLWYGDSGRLLLQTTSGRVTGQYDWYGKSWAGSISGVNNDGIVTFDWNSSLDSHLGRGLFIDQLCSGLRLEQAQYRRLYGGWWYSGDTPDLDRVIDFLTASSKPRSGSSTFEAQRVLDAWRSTSPTIPISGLRTWTFTNARG